MPRAKAHIHGLLGSYNDTVRDIQALEEQIELVSRLPIHLPLTTSNPDPHCRSFAYHYCY